MTLPAYALTTVATVLDELDLENDGGAIVARIERYIAAASSLVAVILGNGRSRQLHEASVTVKVAGMDHPDLVLPHTPIVSITSVKIDGDLVDADEYEIKDAECGFVHRIGGVWPSQMLNVPGVVSYDQPGTERRAIEVVYTAGWRTPAQGGTQTLPAAIEDAAVRLVTARWRRRGRDPRVLGEAFESSNYTFDGAPVPVEIMAALAPYVRVAHS